MNETLNDGLTIPTTKTTIKQFAVVQELDYLVASALVKFLEKIGAAKEVGKEKNPEGTRGKPSTIYEIDNAVEIVFFTDPEVQAETQVVSEVLEQKVNALLEEVNTLPVIQVEPVTEKTETVHIEQTCAK